MKVNTDAPSEGTRRGDIDTGLAQREPGLS